MQGRRKRGEGGGLQPQFSCQTVNPFSTRGTDYAHHSTTSPLGFLDLATALNYAHDFIETTLFAGEKHGTYCGCPSKTTLAETGEISKLKQNLLVPRKSYLDNFKAAAFIPNRFTRQKASTLLAVMNVDINSNSIAQLQKFTFEDILLVTQLIQSKKYDYLAKEYENIGKCVNVSSNDPRLDLGKCLFFNLFG